MHHRSPSLNNSFPSITLPENSAIEGDYHASITIQHYNHGKANPNQPNLRQVDFTELELPGGFSRREKGREEVKPGNYMHYRQRYWRLGVWERRQLHPMAPGEEGGLKEGRKEGKEERLKEGDGYPMVKITGLRESIVNLGGEVYGGGS